MKNLKKIALILIVILISYLIFIFLTENKSLKQDVLNKSLSLIGNKLISLVSNEFEKDTVKEFYDSVTEEANQGNLSPKQIEHLAATILNLNQSDTKITPEQAKTLITYALSKPLAIDTVAWKNQYPTGQSPLSPPITILQPGKYADLKAEWNTVANRIITFNDFDDKIREVIYEIDKDPKTFLKQIKYEVDENLKVSVNLQIRDMIKKSEFIELNSMINNFENKNLLEWEESFSIKTAIAGEKLVIEGETLDQMKNISKLKTLQDLSSIKFLEGFDETISEMLPHFKSGSLTVVIQTDKDTAEVIYEKYEKSQE